MLFLIILLPLSLVSTLPSHLPISGGSDAGPNEFGYQVFLQRNYSSLVCGGAIITQNFIVTAAHCTQNDTPDTLTMIAGSVQRSRGVEYRVEKIIIHEAFDRQNRLNDISLVKVKATIRWSKTVFSIPIRGTRVGSGESAVASGLGVSASESAQPKILQFVVLKTITNEECKAQFDDVNREFIHEQNMCTAGEKRQGTCNGDSGGPLVINRELVGIVSWGVPCAQGYPDVFVRVADYLPWIRNNSDV